MEGENVLAITAWDSESIAAINGTFEMPDGTKFGTHDVNEWKVFKADVDLENCKNNSCLGYDITEDFVDNKDPLIEYADGRPGKTGNNGSTKGEPLVLPDGNWKSRDYITDQSWVTPGSAKHGSPWSGI